MNRIHRFVLLALPFVTAIAVLRAAPASENAKPSSGADLLTTSGGRCSTPVCSRFSDRQDFLKFAPERGILLKLTLLRRFFPNFP